MEAFQGFHHTLVHALTAAAVRCFLKSFQRDRRNEILDTQHIIREFVIDERSVREAQEDAVAVLLTQTDEILLPDHRLTAGVDVHVNAQLFPLTDDVIDLVIGKIELASILSSPAACAVKIAGGSGIQEDSPRDIAVVFFTKLFLNLPALQVDIEEEVIDDGFGNITFNVEQDMPYIWIVGM